MLQIRVFYRVTVAVLAVLLLVPFLIPSVARADGGPIVKDSELWARLKEAQQTAVITLVGDGTAEIDLFVSLLDESGESHEIAFFVPLGAAPANFGVVERTSLAFDNAFTNRLDSLLRSDAQTRYGRLFSLLPGMLLANGAWLLPLSAPLLLGGCMAAEGPVESLSTPSSRVDIYELTEDTDLEALIDTTGLDPSVQATLSRLRGQQIAVVTLQTHPPLPADGDGYGLSAQPGIHLSWATRLSDGPDGTACTFPLGTGTAWARPIELTRVYVVAPSGMDFVVRYPRMGKDYSGYVPLSSPLVWSLKPRIHDFYYTRAHAVDEAEGDFGRVWRVTYTQSNAADDILVVAGSSGGIGRSLRQSIVRFGGPGTMLAGILVSLALWLTAWRYFLPRLLPMHYRWGESHLWWDSLIYPALNLVLMPVAVGAGLLSAALTSGSGAGVILGVAVAGLFILAPGAVIFIWRHAFNLGVSKGRAFLSYVAVVIVANAAYLALAAGYATLIGLLMRREAAS